MIHEVSFERRGYAISSLVLTASACEAIVAELPAAEPRRGGVRNLLRAPTVRRLCSDRTFAEALREFVDESLVAVKATLFDKTPSANWRVQWHQDRVIAVAEPFTAEGFGPWSTKDGVDHVQPPAEVLAQMVAVRVHLDESGSDNGPLRVMPGSHLHGTIPEEELAALVETMPQVELALPQGSVLFMRPLLVHASAPSTNAHHRRVLHLELAPTSLSGPWTWYESLEVGAPRH